MTPIDRISKRGDTWIPDLVCFESTAAADAATVAA
jgi:hypothetical protein